MLNTMRSFAKGFVAKTLMILLVVSFGVWGIGDIFRTSSSGSLAHVGPENVSPQEFANQRSAIRQAMASLSIKNIDASAMDNEIMRRLIQTRLVRLWLHDAGFAVDRNLQASTIQHDMQFHDITGKFDPKMFSQVLNARRVSEGVYLSQLRDEIAGKTLELSLDAKDAPMPASLEKLEIAAQTQTRDAQIVTIPLPAIDTASVSDQQAHDFYELRKAELYMEPERRTLEYVTLDQSDIDALIDKQVTDQALHERFETDKSAGTDFEKAKPALVKQLRSEARDHVLQDFNTQIEDALAGGSSMGEALAKAGVKSQSKLLTKISAHQLDGGKDELLSNVAARGFALNDGETSGLQSTKDGRYFMVALKETNQAAPKAFADVKADVREHVAKENAQTQVRDRAMKAKDLLAKNQPLPADWHANVRIASNLARPQAGPDGKIEAADKNVPAPLQQALFERSLGEVAGPAAMQDGSAVLALVKQVHQPSTPLSDKETQALHKHYQTELSNATTGAMLNNLVTLYPVNVNEKMLQQLTQNTDQ